MNVITMTGSCVDADEEAIEYGSAVGAAIGRQFGESAEEVGAGVGGVTASFIQNRSF